MARQGSNKVTDDLNNRLHLGRSRYQTCARQVASENLDLAGDKYHDVLLE